MKKFFTKEGTIIRPPKPYNNNNSQIVPFSGVNTPVQPSQQVSPFKSTFFQHKNYKSIENQVTDSLFYLNPTNNIHKRNFSQPTKESLENYIDDFIKNKNSVSEIIISPHIPENFPPQKFLEGAVAGAMVFCRLQGMAPEKVGILGAFAIGNPGSNMATMQMISSLPICKTTLNMSLHVPNNLPFSVEDLEKLEKLQMKKFMYFSELTTMTWVNTCLDVKFKSNTKKVESETIQNLTGNTCPDFIRELTPSVGLITKETYDQKFSIASMSNNNHIRPVSANLGKQTDKAIDHLLTQIRSWQEINPNNGENPTGFLLQENLLDLQKNYENTTNDEFYAKSYNALRNTFGDFLIRNEIPMNLVAETGLQNYGLTAEEIKGFKTNFVLLYYRQNSHWNNFIQESMKNSDGTFKNPDLLITGFLARHIISLIG